jgi:hypothetical protein
MEDWWSLGEWSGFPGAKLALDKISCPFCSEHGRFSTEFHAEKKQPKGAKVLNFDTLKCSNCASFVQVFWSASDDRHDFRAQPWSLRFDKAPDHFPADVARYWLQAKKSLVACNYDAAVVMARSAVQLALRAHEAKGANLLEAIDDLTSKGLVSPVLQDWAHNVRELGEEAAHPRTAESPSAAQDAAEVVNFSDFMFEYLYLFPKRIGEFRERKAV